jgi:hypothetical protein
MISSRENRDLKLLLVTFLSPFTDLAHVSHCDITYFKIGSSLRVDKLGSPLLNYAPLGAKTILSHSHFEDNSSPHNSRSSSPVRIKMYLVLFKHVSLM